jgi:hypothetical protein
LSDNFGDEHASQSQAVNAAEASPLSKVKDDAAARLPFWFLHRTTRHSNRSTDTDETDMQHGRPLSRFRLPTTLSALTISSRRGSQLWFSQTTFRQSNRRDPPQQDSDKSKLPIRHIKGSRQLRLSKYERRADPKEESIQAQAQTRTSWAFEKLVNEKELRFAIRVYPKYKAMLSEITVVRYLMLLDEHLNILDRKTIRDAVVVAARDFQSGILPFHGKSLEKLIFLLKHLKLYEYGKKLWEWGQTHAWSRGEPLPLEAYVAALQLYSHSTEEVSIHEIENIYNLALSNTNIGTFADYHLTHNALVDLRLLQSKSGDPKGQGLNPRSIHLLAAISAARLFHGKWRDGYLAFDSASRLSGSRPRFFYESMLEPKNERPIQERYRLARIAFREGISLPPWKIDLLMGGISKIKVRNIQDNAGLLRNIEVTKALMNLFICHLDAGGKPFDGHLNKVLNSLINLMISDSISCAPDGLEFKQEIAQKGFEFLEKVFPLMEAPAQQPHQVAMKLAMLAKDKDLFQSTLQQLFLRGGQATDELARLLIESAGVFGTPDNVKSAWGELIQIRNETKSQFLDRDLISLSRAVRQHNSEELVTFLEQEAETHAPQLNFAYDGGDRNLDNIPSESSTPLDLDGAKKLVEQILDSASSGLSQLVLRASFPKQDNPRAAPNPVTKPILNHTAMGMSISTQPLGAEVDMYKLFDEATVDPYVRESPTYEPISYYDLEQAGNARLKQRFSDWLAITELMAEAMEAETSKAIQAEAIESKSALDADIERPETDGADSAEYRGAKSAKIDGKELAVDGEPKLAEDERVQIGKIISLDRRPRFADLDELKEYVWRLRDIRTIPGHSGSKSMQETPLQDLPAEHRDVNEQSEPQKQEQNV